jgi:hypothetical protein
MCRYEFKLVTFQNRLTVGRQARFRIRDQNRSYGFIRFANILYDQDGIFRLRRSRRTGQQFMERYLLREVRGRGALSALWMMVFVR